MVARSARLICARPGPVELHELLDHALLAEHLGDGQDQVGGGDALAQAAGELEAHHLGRDHVERLAQHHRLGLDAAHAPAQDAQAVDHRGVRVGAHQGVGEGDLPAVVRVLHDDLGQELQVHLVDDAGGGRHHAEVGEGLLPPAQELVALAVALELDLGVLAQGLRRAEDVHLHRVVHHQVHGHEGVDPPRVAAQALHGPAHGGQVHHRGHAREVLEDHPRGHVGQLDVAGRGGVPRGQVPDVVLGDELAVHVAQDGLQQDLDREGEAVEAGGQAGRGEGVQPIEDRGPAPGVERSGGLRRRRASWGQAFHGGERRARSLPRLARRTRRRGCRRRRSAADGRPPCGSRPGSRPRSAGAACLRAGRAASRARRGGRRCRAGPGPGRGRGGRARSATRSRQAAERLRGADEHAARRALAVHRHVQAVVHAIDEVDVDGARRAPQRVACAGCGPRKEWAAGSPSPR